MSLFITRIYDVTMQAENFQTVTVSVAADNVTDAIRVARENATDVCRIGNAMELAVSVPEDAVVIEARLRERALAIYGAKRDWPA